MRFRKSCDPSTAKAWLRPCRLRVSTAPSPTFRSGLGPAISGRGALEVLLITVHLQRRDDRPGFDHRARWCPICLLATVASSSGPLREQSIIA
jgi:hypothetical protein